MEIDVRQVGGVAGLDRRYVVKDGAVEVIDKGLSRGAKRLGSEEVTRLSELAGRAKATKRPKKRRRGPSGGDDMTTTVDITLEDGSKWVLELQSGDDALPVWELVGEVSRASEA